MLDRLARTIAIVVLPVLAACTQASVGLDTTSGRDESPNPVSGRSTTRFAAVVSDSYDSSVTACVDMRGSTSIDGATALRRAWQGVETATLDGREELCRIDGTGQSCGARRGRWQHVLIRAGGAREEASSVPSGYVVRDGDVDAWLWTAAGEPEGDVGISFDEVCEAS